MRSKYLLPLVICIVIVFLVVLAYLYYDDFSPKDQEAITATAQELKDIGLLDVTTYGADKTGQEDSTAKIQKAIDDAYKKDLVVFFPPGTYKVTKTLVALEDRETSYSKAFHLMGSTSGSELPTIKLAPGTFDDRNTSNDTVFENIKKKAVIHMWGCDYVEKSDEGKTGCNPPFNEQLENVNATNGNTAMFLSNSIQNLRIVIEDGNPDAIGIRITGNQRNALSNVSVDVGGGFAGIYGSIGTNSVNQDITVTGGKYGIYGGYGGWGAYTNVVLKNQEVLAFTSHNGPAISLNGFEIEKRSAPVIGEVEGVNYTGSNTYHNGSYTLVEGVIRISEDSDKPVISTKQDRQIAVVNVYANKASKLIQAKDSIYNGNASGWSHIKQYANTVDQVGYKLVDGDLTQTDLFTQDSIVTQGVTPPDTNVVLLNNGLPKGLIPSADVLLNLSKNPNSGVVNVVDRGIIPQKAPLTNDSPDYAQQLNTLFSDPLIQYVFMPTGIYPVKDTVTLGKNTKLIGTAPTSTKIRVHPQWAPNRTTDILNTVDDAGATSLIANLNIEADTAKTRNKFNTIHWRAGRNSVIYYAYAVDFGAPSPQRCRDVADQYGSSRYSYHFSGNGGGRVWGTAGAGSGCSKYSALYRNIYINGTTQPLLIYGFNPEDGHGEVESERDGWQGEINNAKNVSIRSHKSEDANSLLVRNSENIFIINPGGSVDWALRDNKNTMVMNIVSKFVSWPNTKKEYTIIKAMIEEEMGGVITKAFKSDTAVSVIKRGEVNFSAWDFTSDITYPSNTPSPEISSTPTPTPGQPSHSVTPTPGQPKHSATPTPGQPKHSTTPTPGQPRHSATPRPTSPQGNICGRADVDGDGVFNIFDFIDFASAYGMGTNTCADKDEDYGPCGGRDVNRDGKLNISDFGQLEIGFAQRYYPKTSCAL